jgi:hypothetical protein
MDQRGMGTSRHGIPDLKIFPACFVNISETIVYPVSDAGAG